MLNRMKDLSVIIPTHRRPDILAECLRRLEQQTIADRIEAIVVSDGRDEATDALFSSRTWNIPVTYFAIEKAQQGVARNRGTERASAPLCLFIGDDAYLEPDACRIHLESHAHDPTAVLGFTTWDPAAGITDIMRWLEKSGWQFGYPMIERHRDALVPAAVQHRFSYTINISIPTETALEIPFPEHVNLYGWEDVLWGLDLAAAGVPLLYRPSAVALHHHHMEEEDSLRRMHTLGRSVVAMSDVRPNFDRMPRGVKRIALRALALLPTTAGRHRKAFLQGIADAQK